MGAGEAPPGADSPVRAEIVHQSARTRVTRLFFPWQTVIRKEPLGPDAERRLQHEAAMLARLRGADGVAQLAEAPQYAGSIVLADAGSTSLAGRDGPLAAGELTAVAMALAGAVAGMHRRGVMHRDITPANIVLARGGAPCLVDFALAAPLGEIRPEFTHHSEIAGTLAYLAPEATGRTGRAVDQRADLYALGATLYELATGGPPFGTGDPLRLTHDHLARVPVPPAEVNPAVPALLSAVIVHLLEKEPDHRYQSADGVLYDLEQVRDAQAGPAAAPVRIGEHDVPPRLLPPSRLAGRDGEVAALAEAFEDGLAGRCRGVLVGGAPGVGKTALADQLRPVVTGRDGWFVAGKFDQYRRDLEFDAINQAFRALGRLLLAEPEDDLALVRERILAEVGPNAGLVTATVPEFAALLAVPPEPGDPLTCARSRRGNARWWWCSSMTCSGPGAPRSDSWTSCWARSRSRGCCWWPPTGTARSTRRIRWRRRWPGGGIRPGCGTCGWTTCPGRASRPWWRRCCTPAGPRRRAWPGRPKRTRPATRTRRWSCSTRCAATGC
jgi:hypothetical protein